MKNPNLEITDLVQKAIQKKELDALCKYRKKIKLYLKNHPIRDDLENRIRWAFTDTFTSNTDTPDSLESIIDNSNQDKLTKIFELIEFFHTLQKKKLTILLKRKSSNN